MQTGSHKSRRRAWQNDAPTPAEKPNKQVGFDVEGDLGDDPMFPLDLNIFLAEGLAEKVDDAQGTVTPMPEESLQPPPSEGPQCCPTHTEGARPKASAWPFAT